MKKIRFISTMLAMFVFCALFSGTLSASAVDNSNYNAVLNVSFSSDNMTLTLTPVLPQKDEDNNIYAYFGFLITFKGDCSGTIPKSSEDWVEHLNTYVPLGDTDDSYYMFADVNESFEVSSCVLYFWDEFSFAITLNNVPETGTIAEVSLFPFTSHIYFYDGEPNEWQTNPVWEICEDWVDVGEAFYSYVADWSDVENPTFPNWKTLEIAGSERVVENGGGGNNHNSFELEVGEGKDIVSYAGSATVSGSVDNGTATINVACDTACVVAYTTDNGQTYTRVTASQNATSGYDFSVPNYSDAMKFVVAVKGDANGDGTINANDLSLFVNGCNNDYSSSSYGASLTLLIGDTDNNGTLNANDLSTLVNVCNGSGLDW